MSSARNWVAKWAFAIPFSVIGCASQPTISEQYERPRLKSMAELKTQTNDPTSTVSKVTEPKTTPAALTNDIIPVSATTADPAPANNVVSPEKLNIEATMQYALLRNPQLAAIREQHGIAAAGVVLARTYPFNPVYQSTLLHAKNTTTPVDNPVTQAHQLTLDVQLFHQQQYRQQQAFAALTRTDWEIAFQELTFSVNSIRAFDALLYQQGKLNVAEEFLKLNEKSASQVKELVDLGRLKAGDLILAQAEVKDVRAQVSLNRTALITARRNYYRALGVSEGAVEPVGTLERLAPTEKTEQLLAAATELRPDRFARLSAVSEAEAEYQYQSADRFTNLQVGPIYESDDAKTQFVGAKLQVSLPLFNRKQGERMQAQARKALALQTVRQVEVEIGQDVSLAHARLKEAENWVENYRTEIIPSLKRNLEDMDQLFQQGQAGVDVLRLLDVRRKLLRAQDGYLDSLLAYTTALADLAQAVGDPSIAMKLPTADKK